MRPAHVNPIHLDGRMLGQPLLHAPHLPRHVRRPRPTHAAEIYMLDRSELHQTLSQLASSLRSRYLVEEVDFDTPLEAARP
jgi:hypothetical protein